MPRVDFDDLPPDARVWVFGAANALDRIGNEFARSVVSAILEAF